MFSSIGWGEIAVLVVAGLVILGPERLPGAIKWTFGALRQVREYATGARESLKDEFGTDFDDLRQPLSELNQLRGMTPRSMLTKHLLDGDDSFLTGNFDSPAAGESGTSGPASEDIPIKPVSSTPRERSRRAPSIDDWDAT